MLVIWRLVSARFTTMEEHVFYKLFTTLLPYVCTTALVVAIRKVLTLRSNRVKLRELRGKVVVITGGGSGIGEAMAYQFGAYGCCLILASRSVEKLNEVRDKLAKAYPGLSPVVMRLDLTEPETFPDFVRDIIKVHGRVDILVNNAGISSRCGVLDVSSKIHMTMMQVNYFGPVELTNLITKHMVERKSGHIVFMNSLQAVLTLPYRFPYGACKHALYSYSDTLRCELSKHGIRITNILPTYVETQLSRNALTADGEAFGKHDSSNAVKSMSAKFVAQQTLNAIIEGKDNIILGGFLERLYMVLRILANPVYQFLAFKLAQRTK